MSLGEGGVKKTNKGNLKLVNTFSEKDMLFFCHQDDIFFCCFCFMGNAKVEDETRHIMELTIFLELLVVLLFGKFLPGPSCPFWESMGRAVVKNI